MSAYKVVEDFEAALCAYTGAKYAVTTNSCSMALQIAVAYFCMNCSEKGLPVWQFPRRSISIPKRTYGSVPWSIIQGGGWPAFRSENWKGEYQLKPIRVWDSARRFTSGMYRVGQFQCVSFQTSKILGLEQGGAILHDEASADKWLRRMRFDGRLNAKEKTPKHFGFHGYLNASTATLGLQRLACLPRVNPDQAGAADFPDISGLPCFR